MTRFLLAAALFAAAHSHAKPPSVMTAPQAILQNLLLRHPVPRYPREAKAQLGMDSSYSGLITRPGISERSTSRRAPAAQP